MVVNQSPQEKHIGRPVGTGRYNEVSTSKSYRMTVSCAVYLAEKGGREYLESLVPTEYREECKKLGHKKFLEVHSKNKP